MVCPAVVSLREGGAWVLYYRSSTGQIRQGDKENHHWDDRRVERKGRGRRRQNQRGRVCSQIEKHKEGRPLRKFQFGRQKRICRSRCLAGCLPEVRRAFECGRSDFREGTHGGWGG